MRVVLIWGGFGHCLWNLGYDCKNLWLEGLWEHPLNSIHGSPMAFEIGPFVPLEVGVERTSWTRCKNAVTS